MTKIRPMLDLFSAIFKGLGNDLCKLQWDKMVLGLIAIHTAIFFYHIFVMNDIGISLLSAMGVDHASMMDSMMTILGSSGFFNLNEGGHSGYYGWTYFFISFLFLAPLKLIVWCLGFQPYIPIFIGLKILHFFYGLFCAISFYYLAQKFFNKACSVAIALAAMLGTALTVYNYSFHPETLGIFFLNLSCIYLVNLIRSGEPSKQDLFHKYFTILFFLVLCTLCKATFLLVTLPVYIGLLVTYWHKSGRGFADIIKAHDFVWLILKTTAFSFGIFFIIHPFFFIQLKKSIGKQLYNTTAHSSASLAIEDWHTGLKVWAEHIIIDPLLTFTLCALVVSILYGLVTFSKRGFEGRLITLLLVTVLLNAIFTISYFKLFISTSYLTPIMPFLMLNAVAVLVFIGHKITSRPKLYTTFATLILLALAIPKTQNNIHDVLDFYSYKNRSQYKVYTYIKAHVPDGSLIMHDNYVGIPENKNIKGYHYWEVPLINLRNDNADYIMCDPNLQFNEKYQEGTKIFRDHIQSGNFELIEKFGKLEIWKRK